MANGIAGLSSTTALRSAPHRMKSAVSTRSPRVGESSVALPNPGVEGEPCPLSLNNGSVPRPGCFSPSPPPFEKPQHDPGYIKGYVPGIRENGGQYTHASTWTAIAFAAMGDGDKASELFRFMNPINRANSRANVQRYKVEP